MLEVNEYRRELIEKVVRKQLDAFDLIEMLVVNYEDKLIIEEDENDEKEYF